MHLQAMGYYDDRGPTHAHRTPAELAEDEIIAALRGTLRRPFWREVPVIDDPPLAASTGTNRRKEREEP
jgi:hypothetical protein